jgi:hypothetical protein
MEKKMKKGSASPPSPKQLEQRHRFSTLENAFFKELWDTETLQKLFFVHRQQLFPDVGVEWFRPEYLIVSSPMSKPDQDILSALRMLGDARINFEQVVEQQGIEPEKWLPRIKIAFCMLLLRFLDKNPVLGQLFKDGHRSYSQVARHVQGEPLVFDVLPEMKTLLADGQEEQGEDAVHLIASDQVLELQLKELLVDIKSLLSAVDWMKFMNHGGGTARLVRRGTGQLVLGAPLQAPSDMQIEPGRLLTGCTWIVSRKVH